MKRIVMLMLLAVLATAAVAQADPQYGKSGKHKGTTKTEGNTESDDKSKDGKTENADKTVTLTGEVVDLYCYMKHPDTATGADHAKCAKSCMEKGLPVGYLVKGKLYTIIGKDHQPVNAMVANYVGTTSTITGTVIDRQGMHAIELASIGASTAKNTKSAGAKPATTAKMYTCEMDPEVRSDKPGVCPKCGMELVPMKGDKGGDKEKDDEKKGE